MYKAIKTTKGFTLIELLVVIAIIAVLSGLVVVNLAGVRERARDTQRKTELNEVKKALRLYYNDNNRYPASLTTWGDAFTSGGMTYMKQLPSDPLYDADDPDSPQYAYYQSSCSGGTNDYRLVVALENSGDPDIARSGSKCGSGCGFTFSADNNHYVLCPD